MVNNTQGVLHLPLALSLTVCITAAFGFLGLLHSWKSLTETQLRLDRCVAEHAMEFKTKLESVQKANDRIEKLRASIVAATLLPETLPALRSALQAEVLWQDLQRGLWEAKRVTWLARRGCGGSDLPLPLPALPWLPVRDPPDPIGPQALRTLTPKPTQFSIRLAHLPRTSAAQIAGDTKDETRWEARWTNFY